MAGTVFLDLPYLQGKEGNFGNLQWENSHFKKNARNISDNLKILRKDNMNPMKFMNPWNPKIKLGENTLIYMCSH